MMSAHTSNYFFFSYAQFVELLEVWTHERLCLPTPQLIEETVTTVSE